jgi:hypothetical protein
LEAGANPTQKKHPERQEWQTEKITLDDVSDYFNKWNNIGVQFGSVSNGLCDVDLDCKEARALAEYFLPETGAVFGRASTPASHWLYVSGLWQNTRRAFQKFEDPVRTVAAEASEHSVCLVELRTGCGEDDEVKGALSMFPPSLHPSGEQVRWDHDGDPVQINGDELKHCVGKLAAAALLVRHYAPKGQQHDAALVLGGWLARAGWDADRIGHFVEAIARTANDDEWLDRVTAAKGAVQKLKASEDIAGFPRMRKLFSDAIVDALLDWLGINNGSIASASERALDQPSAQPAERRDIKDVIRVFGKWLLLEPTPIYAVLGTVAANMLDGDPVWLGLVAPPSHAKTEVLIALLQLPHVKKAATLTPPSLLSGVPKKQHERGAKGGLLREIGEFGVLVLKDFGSILSMRPDAMARFHHEHAVLDAFGRLEQARQAMDDAAHKLVELIEQDPDRQWRQRWDQFLSAGGVTFDELCRWMVHGQQIRHAVQRKHLRLVSNK